MIYILEDDDSIRKLVQYTLNSQKFETKGFSNTKDFWNEKNVPDLFLLDIMLPDEDGFSVLKKLKSNDSTKKIPVIMLTAKSTEFDKVAGLDLGADDYIPKPFGLMELVARIKAVLRRYENSKNIQPVENILKIKNLTLNISSHQLYQQIDNELKEIYLTAKEFDLLKLLFENRGIVLSRERLLELVWNMENDVETRTVDVHIRSLRSKLGENENLIQTVRGVGYRV